MIENPEIFDEIDDFDPYICNSGRKKELKSITSNGLCCRLRKESLKKKNKININLQKLWHFF